MTCPSFTKSADKLLADTLNGARTTFYCDLTEGERLLSWQVISQFIELIGTFYKSH